MLVTLAALKALLNIRANDSDSDADLTAAIELATAQAEQYCRRGLQYTASDIEELHDGSVLASGPLLLRTFPVVRPSGHTLEVRETEDGGSFAGDDTLLVEGEDYVVSTARGRIWRMPERTCWEPGRQNVRVRYRGGYLGTGDAAVAGVAVVPANVRDAILMQAVANFNRKGQPEHKAETFPGNTSSVTYQRPLGLLAGAAELLRDERRL